LVSDVNTYLAFVASAAKDSEAASLGRKYIGQEADCWHFIKRCIYATPGNSFSVYYSFTLGNSLSVYYSIDLQLLATFILKNNCLILPGWTGPFNHFIC